jgi:hypothetical protein
LGVAIVEDSDVEKALDRLRFGAKVAAKARAERLYLTEYRKSLKALLMKNNLDLPIGGQEREAYAHPDYLKHLEAMRFAIEADELCQWQQVAAQAVIEAWRTNSANQRIETKIG